MPDDVRPPLVTFAGPAPLRTHDARRLDTADRRTSCPMLFPFPEELCIFPPPKWQET